MGVVSDRFGYRCPMRLLIALMITVAALGVTRADDRLTLKLNPSAGWRLEATVQWKRERHMAGDEVEYIGIEGYVINDGAQERVAPKIRIAVVDRDNREIYYWTVAPDEPRVKPGQMVSFSARLESPPIEVAGVELRTVEAD